MQETKVLVLYRNIQKVKTYVRYFVFTKPFVV